MGSTIKLIKVTELGKGNVPNTATNNGEYLAVVIDCSNQLGRCNTIFIKYFKVMNDGKKL